MGLRDIDFKEQAKQGSTIFGKLASRETLSPRLYSNPSLVSPEKKFHCRAFADFMSNSLSEEWLCDPAKFSGFRVAQKQPEPVVYLFIRSFVGNLEIRRGVSQNFNFVYLEHEAIDDTGLRN